MTDIEIINWLYNLEPETKEQENKIKKMMIVMLEKTQTKDTTPKSVKLYFEPIMLDEIIGKKTEKIYNDYCNWCKENNHIRENKMYFSRLVCKTFNVKTVCNRINDKVVRVYKYVE